MKTHFYSMKKTVLKSAKHKKAHSSLAKSVNMSGSVVFLDESMESVADSKEEIYKILMDDKFVCAFNADPGDAIKMLDLSAVKPIEIATALASDNNHFEKRKIGEFLGSKYALL